MARYAKQQVPVIWECSGNEKQQLFLSCPADEILYGGAAGGGKSDALLVSGIGQPDNGIFTNPNWKVLVLRRTFPELEKSLIFRSQQLFYGKGRYDGVKHRWMFPSGGLMQFGHIKNDADVVQYQSAEYSMIIFDELTHFSERMYLYLFSRLRTTDPTIRSKIKAGTNPGGVGHGWVKKRFIDDKEPMKIYANKMLLPGGIEDEWSQCYIPATVFDNAYLIKNDPQYVRRLMELPEVEKQALLYGNWDIFSGQFFTEWGEHHVCDDFDFPNDWPVWISMDWGYATRCAVLLFTQDPTTEVYYLFDEIFVQKQDPDIVSATIKRKLGAHFPALCGRFADRRIMVKNEDTNISTKERFSFNGLHFQLATDDRVEGWTRARELLMKDEEGNVKFQVMRKCSNFIRLVQEAIFAPSESNPAKAEDMDPRGEYAHICDAFRYFAIMRKHRKSFEPSTPMTVSSVTGYMGMQGREEVPLRHQIRRLTNLKAGVNYFMDRPSKTSKP